MESTGEPLDESTVDPDPLLLFHCWFDDAAAVMAMPEAMALATADRDGMPSVRMVLLKSFGTDGFVFYTNYESRKGDELVENPRAALLFHWEPLGRQVRIEGPVTRVGGDESDAYFATRPAVASSGRTPPVRAGPSATAARWRRRSPRSMRVSWGWTCHDRRGGEGCGSRRPRTSSGSTATIASTTGSSIRPPKAGGTSPGSSPDRGGRFCPW